MSFKDAKEEWEEYFNENDDFFGIVEPRLDDNFWQDRYSAIWVESEDASYNKRFATTTKGLDKASKYVRRLKSKRLFWGFKFVRKMRKIWKDLSYGGIHKDKENLMIKKNRQGVWKRLIALDGTKYIKHNFWGTKDETTSE